jgi:hypothetical protein
MYFTGYKQRDKISKALRTRAQAIQNAIARYNEAAQALSPPQDSLTWEEVIHMATIGDFDLLRNSHQDIRQLRWSDTEVRKEMSLFFGLERAKEEIERLNVEIRRLVTFMVDEDYDYQIAIAQAKKDQNFSFAKVIESRWKYATAINGSIARQIRKTSKLSGFSGSLEPGESEHRASRYGSDLSSPPWLDHLLSPDMWADEALNASDWQDAGIEEEDENETSNIVELVENVVLLE